MTAMHKLAIAFAVALGTGLCTAAPPAQAQFDTRNGSPFFFQPSMPPPRIQQQMDQDRREMQQFREDARRREIAREQREDRQGFQPERRGQGPADWQGYSGQRRGPVQNEFSPYYNGRR